MSLTVYRADGTQKAARVQVVGDSPAGAIVAYAGTAVPSDWLACNGAAVSRITYPDLFIAIGTTWGSGDGSTTFNLPDLRGRSIIGSGTGVGGNANGTGKISGGSALSSRVLSAYSGEESHLLSTTEMPSHTHAATSPGAFVLSQLGFINHNSVDNSQALTGTIGSGSAADTSGANTAATGGGLVHENMPPFAVANWIIRVFPPYKMASSPIANNPNGYVANLSQQPVLDVGVAGQIRAGRQLTVADFTSLGLSTPIGLFNLSGLTNLGSDPAALQNKNTTAFDVGINGLATTAAVFRGASGTPANDPVLYITGANAGNYNIRTGSWGCWFRTAKRGTNQRLFSKMNAAGGQHSWSVGVAGGNVAYADVSVDGTALLQPTGISDICDDRWHFAVVTVDSTTLRLYVDGVLETTFSVGSIFAGSAPLNIGGYGGDAGTALGSPHYGRVDEAFVTNDVLSEDQIRCLYAAKIVHGLGIVPTNVSVNVTRRRRGASLAVTDFTTSPIRLYNFTAGDLVGVGSDFTGARTLTPNGAPVTVAGADGTLSSAISFNGASSLSATDTGLPNLLTTRSYGCWFKTTSTALGALIGWGTYSTGASWLHVSNSPAGVIVSSSAADGIIGPFVADGQWHFVVVVEDNTPAPGVGDGVKRKLYLDGRLVGGSTVLNSITLAGATRFRIGALPEASWPLTGQIDGAFVCGYALTAADIAVLYAKGSQALAPSPKNAGDHVESLVSDSVLFIADTLESQHMIDMGVMT